MPLMGFGRVNLPIEENNITKNSYLNSLQLSGQNWGRGYSSEFWRSLEPQICNFFQIFLHKPSKCIYFKSILVNNLNLVLVRNPLLSKMHLCALNNSENPLILNIWNSHVIIRVDHFLNFFWVSGIWWFSPVWSKLYF